MIDYVITDFDQKNDYIKSMVLEEIKEIFRELSYKENRAFQKIEHLEE